MNYFELKPQEHATAGEFEYVRDVPQRRFGAGTRRWIFRSTRRWPRVRASAASLNQSEVA